LIDEANRQGVKVLGLEGFIIGDGGMYSALGHIADFSDDPADVAHRKAISPSCRGVGITTHAR
jgi:hypothetical protein